MKRTIYRINEYSKEIRIPDTDNPISIIAPLGDGDLAAEGTEAFPDLASAVNALIKKHGEEFAIDYRETNVHDCLYLDQFAVEEVVQVRESEDEDWEDESWGCFWEQAYPNSFCFGHGSSHTVAFHMGRGEYFPVCEGGEYTVRPEYYEELGVDAEEPTVFGQDIGWRINSYEDLKKMIEEAE